MSNTKSTLTAERLRMLVNYDRETGLFTRIFRSGTKVKIGDPAGHKHRMGYLAFCIDAKPHLAHRLAWLYVYGSWPTGHIDHINGRSNQDQWPADSPRILRQPGTGACGLR